MAINAPYYQLAAGQLFTGTNNSSAAAQTGGPQDEDYVPTSATVIEHTTENQYLPLYSERTTRLPGADSQHNTFEENHNLVELLEAATSAADQASMAVNSDETAPVVPAPQSKSRRKRDSSPSSDVPTTSEALPQDRESSTAKRRRVDTSSTDPNLLTKDNDTAMRSPASQTSPLPTPESLLTDARAAGVHSAAALFRRTSSNTTRKYTRPPMSKLFMSLSITPENFIALQALAKAYMLSPAHPERQSCVGNRGKGDTDMVKLRLFNCVRDFLADGGVGEQFFGEHVEKPGERENSEAAAALGEKEGGGEKLVWPRDGNKIISLVTPLMRRMVTNERQRLYAIDTRKGGKKAEKEGSVEAGNHGTSPGPSTQIIEQHLQTALDPTLQRPATIQRNPPSTPTTTTAQIHTSNTIASPTSNLVPSSPAPTIGPAEPHLTHINIFLTYTPGSSKQNIKLDEKRISTTRPAHLTFYNYNAFVEQVGSMVEQAKLLWPQMKDGRIDKGASQVVEDNESLRGLAKAANALTSTTQGTLTGPDAEPSTTTPQDACLRYTVKTIGPAGWQVIDSAEAWYHVLAERAFAMWADGVCNIMVELHGARLDGGVLVESKMLDGEVQMEDA